jgi:hypothetical protein
MGNESTTLRDLSYVTSLLTHDCSGNPRRSQRLSLIVGWRPIPFNRINMRWASVRYDMRIGCDDVSGVGLRAPRRQPHVYATIIGSKLSVE